MVGLISVLVAGKGEGSEGKPLEYQVQEIRLIDELVLLLDADAGSIVAGDEVRGPPVRPSPPGVGEAEPLLRSIWISNLRNRPRSVNHRRQGSNTAPPSPARSGQGPDVLWPAVGRTREPYEAAPCLDAVWDASPLHCD